MSCSYRLRPVRAECNYDAKGALFHLGATLFGFLGHRIGCAGDVPALRP